MKAISLWQPWASLLFTTPRTKIHETRHWGTSHRGAMYIHAAKKLISECGEDLDEICIDRFGAEWRKTLPRGAIIGIVHLIDCMRTDSVAGHTTKEDLICGDFYPGRFAWSLGMPTPIGPGPEKGQQGRGSISESEMDAVANKTLGIAASDEV